MSVHVDDLGIVICEALQETETCKTILPWEFPEGKQRDKKIVISAVGRDWFRGFHITIEALDPYDIEGDFQADWKEAPSG